MLPSLRKFYLIFCVISFINIFSILSVKAQTNNDSLPEEVVNAIAQKTITKFESSSCQDLATSMAKKPPATPTLKDQLTARLIEKLKADPSLAQDFFNQISTPVLTKLFEF